MQPGDPVSKASEVSELNNGGCQRLCWVELRAKSTENDENRPREHHIMGVYICLQYVKKRRFLKNERDH